MSQRNQRNPRGNAAKRGASNSAARNPPNNNGNRRGKGRQQPQNNENAQDLNLQGIMHLHELEQIQKDIREHQLLIGSTDLLNRLNVPAVSHRMDRMFREVQKQEEFLGLILETAKASLRQEQLREMGSLFLRRIFNTKLVANLMDEHISKIRSDPQKRQPPASKIAEHLCQLFVLGWRAMPTVMAQKFHRDTDSTIYTLNFPSIQSATFPTEKTKQLLAEIQQVMQNHFDATEERTIANAANQQQKNADANKNNCTGPPPEDFRDIQVAPREQDFLCSNAEVYLRKAIIEGPYQDDEHYLDVQFRLMREDLYRPLRDGIAQFRRMQAEARIAGANRPPKTDLFVYSGVRFDGMELNKESGALLSYFRLNKSDRSKRMHKRLMFGALVCLSTDRFNHHYVFGIVIDRDKLERGGLVGINLLTEVANGGRRPQIQLNIDYSMVESPAFYEAYKHVLTALQAFPNGVEIPFSKYFVHLDANVAIPRYLILAPGAEERDLDFECLLTKRAKEYPQYVAIATNENYTTKCKATRINEHFGAEDFGMDQSQFDALVHAIRSDLAVIQGPPGTGKTYLGLKLVQLLFANEQLWKNENERQLAIRFTNEVRRPMLVVCYTNHALDQFLEGMIPFLEGTGIVRVGGRCKNEELDKFTLGKLRAEQRYRIDEVILDSQNRREYFECREQLKKILNSREYWKKACNVPGWILDGKLLEDAADELPIEKNFYELIDSKIQLCLWLGQAKKAENQLEMDIGFVRMMVYEMGMQELEARALAYIAAGIPGLKQQIWENRARALTKKIWNQMMRTMHQDRKFMEETQHWPQLRTLEEFGGTFERCENLAIQWLQSVNGNSVPILQHLRQIGLRIAPGRGQGAQQIGNQNNNQPPELFFGANEQFGNEAAGEDDNENDQRNIYADNSDTEEEYEEEEMEEWRNFANLSLLHFQQQKIDLKIWMERNSRLREFFLQRTKAMDRIEAQICLENDHPWDMPLHDRWRLYRFLANRWEQKENEKQDANATKYFELNQRYQYYRGQTDLAILKRAKVVGMTTTGAARLQCSLRSLKPRIVVVEEAAEVFEPHIVTSLTECCEHLILIGDHQQLRPSPSDYRLGKDYHLDISLFERLVKNGFRFQTLRKQHRMRPEISRPLMPHFYRDLEDDASVFDRDDIQGMQKNVFFINHNEAECSQRKLADGKSKANPFEAEFAVRIAKYLTQQEYAPEQITILCTYVEQMFDVRNRMKAAFPAPAQMKTDQAQNAQTKSIRVDVVDNYQGEECDIIILSLVRSNHPDGKIGFLNIPNRVCVALSRAKLGFYVLGNFDYLSENCRGEQPKLWSGIRRSMVEQNAIGGALPIVCKLHGQQQEIHTAEEFMDKSPEGGCWRPCIGRLDCGHVCHKWCHAYDIDHAKATAECVEKCARMCANDLHQSCQLPCNQKCTKCTEIVEKTLKCGHKTKAECWKPIDKISCQEKCTKTWACFHECKGFCSAPCPPCTVPVLKVLPCKHQKVMDCSQSVATIKCQVPVKKRWPICGHVVETKCHVNPENVPCPNKCVKMLKEDEEGKDECTHPCKGTCGQCRNGRLHIECKEECKRILICDHVCGSKCSNGCPPCTRPCETRCGHSQCSLVASGPGEKQQKIRKGPVQNPKEGRRCGELCPPCKEQCLNECPHRKCSKLCSEPCDVLPCNEPCAKRLKCSPPQLKEGFVGPNLPVHLCAGMCSENCIEICRICEPEKFQEEVAEFFFGEEDEPDAHFVQLQDCGHYVEVMALDKWVMEKVEQRNEETDRQIIQIPCPKCRAPIRRSKRYISLLNKRAMEIEQVKMKIIGAKSKKALMDQWTLKQKEMVAWLKEWQESMSRSFTTECVHIGQRIVDIRNRIENFPKVNVTAQWMDSTLKNIENFLFKVKDLVQKVRTDCPATIVDWAKQLEEFKINANNVQSFLLGDLDKLMERISACPGNALHLINGATFGQLSSELGRNEFMLNLFKFLKKVAPPKSSPPVAAEPVSQFERIATFFRATPPPAASNPASQLVENVLEILHKLHGQTPFIEIHAQMEERLKMLADKFGIAGLGIGVEEFLQIHKAFDGNIGQWYVCSNGHAYSIGECGQAMARGRCPECQEEIGGEQHRLVGTSQQATELTTILRNVDPRMRYEYNPFVARF